LPSGLHEESCYRAWNFLGVAPAALDALAALRTHIRGVDQAVPELAVVSEVADALAWDLGLVVSQFTFGKSPLGSDDASDDLAPWDRTFTLRKVEPYTSQSSDFGIPKAAKKSFDLLPWRAPFLYL
jgi:hypothetical protein